MKKRIRRLLFNFRTFCLNVQIKIGDKIVETNAIILSHEIALIKRKIMKGEF